MYSIIEIYRYIETCFYINVKYTYNLVIQASTQLGPVLNAVWAVAMAAAAISTSQSQSCFNQTQP